MLSIEKKICVFIHFSHRSYIPYNVQVYVNHLAQYFEEVRLLTNKRDIDQIANLKENVRLHFEKNEGHGLGMFYRFAITQDLNKYTEIAIIEDSNILVNSLENTFKEGRNQTADFWGLISSSEKPRFSTHENNFHIQSHFLVLNRKAIYKLSTFIVALDVKLIFKENNIKILKRHVVNEWEIGLSQFLIKAGLEHFVHISPKENSTKNIAFTDPLGIINEGYPLLKKKVYHKASSRSRSEWANLIKETLPKEWNAEQILEELEDDRKMIRKPFFRRILPF